jgi:hypothetical protein
MKQMNQIFISYIAEDGGVARAIVSGLEAAGYRTWYYERDSLPGEPHLNQTGRAIIESSAYMIIISDQCISSPQVETELVHAHEAGTPIVPILVDLTFDELRNRKPMWRIAMGAAVALQLGRDAVDGQIPKLVAGLRNLGVRPTDEDLPRLLVRVTGFLKTEDGGFLLERLVANDIAFHSADSAGTIHQICRDIISVLLAKGSPGGSAKLADNDMVSVWTTDREEILPEAKIDTLEPGSVVSAILNERQYPPHVLKFILRQTPGLLS